MLKSANVALKPVDFRRRTNLNEQFLVKSENKTEISLVNTVIALMKAACVSNVDCKKY